MGKQQKIVQLQEEIPVSSNKEEISNQGSTDKTIPLLPEVEKFYEANPSLRGTCTRLEQELEAALTI